MLDIIDDKPSWFHPHGHRIGLVGVDREHRTVVLRSSAVTVVISPEKDQKFKVAWTIDHSPAEMVTGTVLLQRPRLLTAFLVLPNLPPEESQASYLKRFEVDAGAVGYFIRRSRFLNLPCPGTGHDGDPNVSIVVTQEITNAIGRIVG